jgi:leucine efflux protein
LCARVQKRRDGLGHRPSDKRQRGKNQIAEKCKLLGAMFQKALHYDTFPVYDPVMDDWSNWTQLGITDLPTFILGTIAIVLLPGPNSLYVLTASSQRGWRQGVWASLGIVVGDSVLMLAIVLGAASVLQSSPALFSIVRLLGALYLAWIGMGLVQIAWQRYQGGKPNAEGSFTGRLMQLHPFMAALGLSLTNPKAIFFFISFFTQFVDPASANPALSFLYLAIILQIISVTYLGMLVWVGQGLVERFQHHPRWAAGLWFAVGFLFIAFAVRLAFSDQVVF